MDSTSALFIVVVLILVWRLVRKANDKKFIISPQEAKQRLDSKKGIVLLDVRSKEEYEEKRIPKSVLLPLSTIKAQAAKNLPNKDAEILVYCRTGNRSAAAVRILTQLGYTNVKNLGGIVNWPFDTVSKKK